MKEIINKTDGINMHKKTDREIKKISVNVTVSTPSFNKSLYKIAAYPVKMPETKVMQAKSLVFDIKRIARNETIPPRINFMINNEIS